MEFTKTEETQIYIYATRTDFTLCFYTIAVTANPLTVCCCVTVIYKPWQHIHLTCTHFTLRSLQTYQLCQCWSVAALSIWHVQRAVLSTSARET